MIEIEGKRYIANMGSDVVRDGMYLELRSESGEDVAEVFHADADGSMGLTAYQPNVPVAVVAWLLAQSEARLRPASARSDR